jgi:hypothetical protein
MHALKLWGALEHIKGPKKNFSFNKNCNFGRVIRAKTYTTTKKGYYSTFFLL